MAPLRDGSVILDCGCGTGNLCSSILDQFPTVTLVAVDNDATMAQCFRVKLADRLSAEPSLGRVCFLESDVMAIFPWLAAHHLQPDYAFLVNVLYLLDDPVAALRGIAGCLRPGGELRLSNPDERTDLDALFRQLERDLADTQHDDDVAEAFSMFGAFNREHLASALNRHSGAELRRLVLDAGFRRITHSTHDHYAGQSLLLAATV